MSTAGDTDQGFSSGVMKLHLASTITEKEQDLCDSGKHIMQLMNL